MATTPAKRACSFLAAWCLRSARIALALSLPWAAAHAGAPPIRTSPENAVPGCVTPQRLMSFLKSRNPNLHPRYEAIASLYKRHGEAWRGRGDYAFFQMAVETNFLTFQRGEGGWGDVKPGQNNFAGLGTTGGGVPGDSYPDIDTGVLAQIQHLVVYSGERIADPVAPRTKLKQDDILQSMAHLDGRTTFADLARRWAKDRHYGAAIEWVAGNYRAAYCREAAAQTNVQATLVAADAQDLPRAAALGGPTPRESVAKTPPVRTIWSRSKQHEQTAPPAKKAMQPKQERAAAPAASDKREPAAPARAERPAQAVDAPKRIEIPSAVGAVPDATPAPQPAAVPSEPRAFAFAAAMDIAALTAIPVPQPVAASARCRVLSASYGGKKTLLVRARAGAEVRYTALTVLEGFEGSMLENYIKAHAPGGANVGAFETRDAALARAKELCPGAAAAPRAEGASAG